MTTIDETEVQNNIGKLWTEAANGPVTVLTTYSRTTDEEGRGSKLHSLVKVVLRTKEADCTLLFRPKDDFN